MWENLWPVVVENVKWIFSGVGIILISIGYKVYKRIWGEDRKTEPPTTAKENGSKMSSERIKDRVYILFVDDEKDFKVVDIIKRAGWRNTKSVRDIKALNEPDVLRADIFFVDIQGVGIALGFKDQGLGLAMALKEKYPEKYLVIYSSVKEGDRFHKAFDMANARLPKDAEPIQFLNIIENTFERGDHV